MTTEELANKPVYVAGLDEPLTVIAEILEDQGYPDHATAVRVAILLIKKQELVVDSNKPT